MPEPVVTSSPVAEPARRPRRRRHAFALVAALLAACGGGGGSGAPIAPPLLVGVSPPQGFASVPTPVTITGSGFVAPVGVTVGGAAATDVVVVDASTITCKTPPGLAGATVDFTVTSAGRTVTGLSFRYADPLADLEGTWFGAQGSMTTLGSAAPHGFTADAVGNGTMTFVGGMPTLFAVLDEPNRVYRMLRGDGLTAILVMSADKRHLADLDEFRAVGVLERGAGAPAAEGHWHADLRQSTWNGVAVLPSAGMLVSTVQVTGATVDDLRRFTFAGATTAAAPLELAAGAAGEQHGLFAGDVAGPGAATGAALLLQSPDKTFAAVATSLGDITTTVLGAWERTSAPPPARPVVLLATTPLALSDVSMAPPPGGAQAILGGFRQDLVAPATLGAITPPITPADAPLLHTSDRSSGPEIAAWFDSLVDGLDHMLCCSVNGATLSFAESASLQNRHPSLTGVDLQGARLVQLAFQLDSYSLVPSGGGSAFEVVGTLSWFGRVE